MFVEKYDGMFPSGSNRSYSGENVEPPDDSHTELTLIVVFLAQLAD
jgi:hypothetical protein